MAAGVVVFVYADWAARYPELAAWCSSALSQLYFNEATLYCDNTLTSPIADVLLRTPMLYMVTSHIAAMNAPLNGVQSSPLVGRISDATEGSVTVKAQMDFLPGSAQWWNQTKYGAAFWAATLQYRLARYMPGPVRTFQPYGVRSGRY